MTKRFHDWHIGRLASKSVPVVLINVPHCRSGLLACSRMAVVMTFSLTELSDGFMTARWRRALHHDRLMDTSAGVRQARA